MRSISLYYSSLSLDFDCYGRSSWGSAFFKGYIGSTLLFLQRDEPNPGHGGRRPAPLHLQT